MKPIYLLFLFSPFCIKAQFTYQDLKKSVDATTSEASRIFKSKGFTFSSAEDDGVSYDIFKNQKNAIYLNKRKNNAVALTYIGKINEPHFNNILETILKLGYEETNSEALEDRFCTNYESTNYIMVFCDWKITYSDDIEAPVYSIFMTNKYY